MSLLYRTFLTCILCLGAIAAGAQSGPVIDNNFVQKNFGSTCSLITGKAPMVADFNNDGVQDIAVAAHCSNPLIDQTEFNFKVVDPYNSFFGYGDPKITSEFASEDPALRGQVLLIIHGSGAEGWHSASPKGKFILINLPFKQVEAKKLMVRKKPVMAIYAAETGGDQVTSATFWDGRKYKYQPIGSALE